MLVNSRRRLGCGRISVIGSTLISSVGDLGADGNTVLNSGFSPRHSDARGSLALFDLDDHPLARLVVDLKLDFFVLLSAKESGSSGMPH